MALQSRGDEVSTRQPATAHANGCRQAAWIVRCWAMTLSTRFPQFTHRQPCRHIGPLPSFISMKCSVTMNPWQRAQCIGFLLSVFGRSVLPQPGFYLRDDIGGLWLAPFMSRVKQRGCQSRCRRTPPIHSSVRAHRFSGGEATTRPDVTELALCVSNGSSIPEHIEQGGCPIPPKRGSLEVETCH